MSLITRRGLLKRAGALGLATTGLGSYTFGFEPGFMLELTPYALTPPSWPGALKLRIAVIADIHACEPYMSAARVRSICKLANSLNPDVTVILGDFNGGHNFVTAPVMPEQWGEAVSILKAPLGVYSILGNHDWWHGPIPKMRGDEAESVRRALRHANIKLLENDAIQLNKDGQDFWLLGLADQLSYRVSRGVYRGTDKLEATLSAVKDDAPIVLLAHEPFVFDRVPKRVSLTLCGHTHGGQVNLPIIGAPFAESRFGKNHIYGHIVEDGRDMIISAGLGTSILPARFGRPPEVVVVDLGTAAIA
jgi:predicted MPP superfamily phosphohydrolase